MNINNAFIFMFLLIVVSSCQSQINSDTQYVLDSGDQYCTDDDDCVMVMVECSCHCGIPINKEHWQKYMDAKEKKCESYVGRMCKMACDSDLKCINNLCVNQV